MNDIQSEVSLQMKLLSIQEQNKRLQEAIDKLKAEALEASRVLQETNWRIKRSEFIAYCDGEEFRQQRELMGKLKDMIITDTSVERELDELKAKKEKLIEEKNEIDKQNQMMDGVNQKNKVAIRELTDSIENLRKKNAVTLQRLQQTKQEYENQMEKYSAMLTNNTKISFTLP